jgi:hypothetical protein
VDIAEVQEDGRFEWSATTLVMLTTYLPYQDEIEENGDAD